jgi:hypothetical protein
MHIVTNLRQIPVSCLVVFILLLLPTGKATCSFQKVEIVCRRSTEKTARFRSHTWIIILHLLIDF